MGGDMVDHPTQRGLCGVVEIRVHAHRDDVGRRFRLRVLQVEIGAQDDLDRSFQRSLDRGGADLAIALHPMAVAEREPAAFDVDRQVQRRTRDQFLVVQVAAVGARLDGRNHSPGRRRRDAHHAEERPQRQLGAPRKPAHVPFAVQPDDHLFERRKIVRQRAGQRPHIGVAPILAQLDVQDADLQHVARLGASHRDRAGQNVARHAPLDFGMDAVQLGRHVIAGTGQIRDSARDGLDRHPVAAVDGQHRLQRGVEPAPVHRAGVGSQAMLLHAGGRFGISSPRATAGRATKASTARFTFGKSSIPTSAPAS